jgi:hypothetical protein
MFTSTPKHDHRKQNISRLLEPPFQRRNSSYQNTATYQQPTEMAPTTRASTRKTALADSRDIVSWASAATGEILYYERFHCYEEEGEVLFVQMRMCENGELVPWTTDDEDGTSKIYGNSDDMVTDSVQKTKTP